MLGLPMILLVSAMARADDVTDRNQHVLRAGTVGGTSPPVQASGELQGIDLVVMA